MAIKRTITLNFKTSDDKTLPASFDVNDGESTFDIWKKLPGNAAKTEQQFITEQKGTPGAPGASIVSVSVQVKENP
ncbi:MAG: hypothetical protein KA732_00670 [Providencia sp.]|uniref:hypothetical protein n=1 Tax=Providencia sp. TaxID=589 RepID=UPI001B5A2846|nr:hypothetical protein [Providencia sp.]